MRSRVAAWLVVQGELHCCWCGKPLTISSVSLEHLQPKALFGTFANCNIVPACKPCNEARGSTLVSTWAERCVTRYGAIPKPTVMFLAIFQAARPKWADEQGVTPAWLTQLQTTDPLWGIPNDRAIWLTGHQTRIIGLLAKGFSIREIANELGGRIDGVKRAQRHICRRLSVSTRLEAIETARRLGLLADIP